MAGRGPSPKSIASRRNHHEPQRGEWVELAPLVKPVLPALPRGDGWNERTKRAWESWRKDPATGVYGPSEIQQAIDLAYVYEDWTQAGSASLAAEVRQRQDGLGLSLKGKQDRRWRVAVSTPDEVAEPVLAEVRTLRIA